MSKPFDATLKDLICSYPADWLNQLGIPVTEPPEVISADLSTVTATADTLIRVGNLVVHIDVESGPDDSLARRMLLYNVLAHHHTGLPVRSVAVLLRAKAQRANLSPRLEYEKLSFQFDIVRMWEVLADDLLQAGVGLLPLAVVGKPPSGTTREKALPRQVEKIVDRVERDAKPEIGKLMTATYILASMHVEPTVAREVINRVLNMKELPGYKLILEEGAIDHMHELIVKVGRKKLGEPNEKQLAKLKAIQDLDRLDRIVLKASTAKRWDTLLRTA